MKLPKHLGGSNAISNVDREVLEFIINKYQVKSMIDIGCGEGEMVGHAIDLGLETMGIDGDYTLKINYPFTLHDYTTGPAALNKNYDLVWSVEFVEHVSHKYLRNFISNFQNSKYVMMTYALPYQTGYHHVNCMPCTYWLGVMEMAGFQYLELESIHIRKIAKNQYIKRTGSLFVRNELIENYPIRLEKIPQYYVKPDIYIKPKQVRLINAMQKYLPPMIWHLLKKIWHWLKKLK